MFNAEVAESAEDAERECCGCGVKNAVIYLTTSRRPQGWAFAP